MRVAVPPYFDGLIAGFRAGRAGRNVHLGYWDDPPPLSTPCQPGEFEAAQARLTNILIGMAHLADGQDVLDVGCGFGGTLETIGGWRGMRRVGVNIDARQLEICRTLPVGDSPLRLLEADACALPLDAESFDRVFCIEAMFHFQTREVFLAEAARVLRRGGRLVVSDILLRDPGVRAPRTAAEIETHIRREYGPWPRVWIEPDEVVEAARRAGLAMTATLDATRQTLPTYRVTAPQLDAGFPSRPSAGNLLRWLHAEGFASYLCWTFTKA